MANSWFLLTAAGSRPELGAAQRRRVEVKPHPGVEAFIRPVGDPVRVLVEGSGRALGGVDGGTPRKDRTRVKAELCHVSVGDRLKGTRCSISKLLIRKFRSQVDCWYPASSKQQVFRTWSVSPNGVSQLFLVSAYISAHTSRMLPPSSAAMMAS